MNQYEQGEYTGRLVLTPLDDGIHMQLCGEFGFRDSNNKQWSVDPAARVDGASIPRFLWSVIGSPFTGKYVKASVIHDYHCDVRMERWQDVHRVFYNAMRVSGVPKVQAKTMYLAVYYQGPRWSENVSYNTKLCQNPFTAAVTQAAKPGTVVLHAAAGGEEALEGLETSQSYVTLQDIDRLVSEYDPSIDEIENAAETLRESSIELTKFSGFVDVAFEPLPALTPKKKKKLPRAPKKKTASAPAKKQKGPSAPRKKQKTAANRQTKPAKRSPRRSAKRAGKR